MATNMNDTVSFLRQQGVSDQGIKNLLGQMKAESGNGAKVENLNWSTKTLLKYYGKPGTYKIDGKDFVVKPHKNKIRFNTLEEAQATKDAGAEAIGNKLYGGRMGNADNEGYKYRGRTSLQITGKEAYEALDKKLGLNGALVENPDLINDPAYEQKAIYSFLTDFKKMKPVDFEDMSKLHKKIGPGTGGVASDEYKRRVQYAKEIELPVSSEPLKSSSVAPPPAGIDPSDTDAIKSIQAMSGLTGKDVDGVWGPQSAAAYANKVRNDTAELDPRRTDVNTPRSQEFNAYNQQQMTKPSNWYDPFVNPLMNMFK